MRNLRHDAAALSEVIGTVLLLGITIVAFAGVALAVQARLETAPPAPNVKFELLHEGPNQTLVHRWGESVPTDELRIIWDTEEGRTDLVPEGLGALAEAKGGSDKTWDLGEDLQVVCRPIDPCVGAGRSGAELFLVHMPSQTVLFREPRGVS